MTTDAQLLWQAREQMRQDREWAGRTTDERMQISRLQQDADYIFQAADRGMPPPHAGDSVDRYRTRLLQALCPSSSIPTWLAREPEALEKMETGIAKQIIEKAHQRPTLQPIFRKGPDGRVATEFIGKKSAWMNQFKVQPQLGTITVDGQPVEDIPLC